MERRLPKFEGREVAGSSIAVVGAGDGLSDALEVDPVALKHGEEGFLILRYRARDVDHVQGKGKKRAQLRRKHVLSTEYAVLVQDDDDAKLCQSIVEADHDAVQRAKDAVAGQGRIDDQDA